VGWIAAQAFEEVPNFESLKRKREKKALRSRAPEFPASASPEEGLRAHQFPPDVREEPVEIQGVEDSQVGDEAGESVEELDYAALHALEVERHEREWEERRRARELQRQLDMDREANLRRYRGRTVALLRRYMRLALEAGRLPSVLGSLFFRTGVTSYGVMTFEERVIFVRDMEICLGKLDDQSREILGRCVIQGHDLRHTARLTQGTTRTTRRNIPEAIDNLTEILLKMGLLEEQVSNRETSCQEVKNDEFPASDCEQGK
jgi:hypothetical protein